MKDGLFGIVEMLIFLGLPLAWAIWELVSLRREQVRDRARQESSSETGPPPEARDQ